MKKVGVITLRVGPWGHRHLFILLTILGQRIITLIKLCSQEVFSLLDRFLDMCVRSNMPHLLSLDYFLRVVAS